ncbi:DUF1643 domain-containing protein [Natrinema thermotolerans]
MPRKCRQCGRGTGSNRRLCTDCEREARDTSEPSTPLETTAGDAVGAWICVDGTWHASVAFDGSAYDFACGDGFADFPAEDVTHSHHALDHESVCLDCRAAIDPASIPDPWADVIGDDTDSVSLREGETREDSGHTSVVNQTLADADDEYLEQIGEDPEQYRCDGGNETAQQTLGGETLETDDDPETSEDYKYTRPQCRAITNGGDRCSNPVRRTDGEPEFCPRHHDTDCETIDDRLATDGGTELPTLEDVQPVATDGGQPPLQDNRSDAVLSDDGEYRYRLTRTWDTAKPTVAFLMLNPSTADASEDDSTIRRCLGFAKDWGYGSLVVANLFGLRSTDPSNLRDHADPVGPENDAYLRDVCDEAELVVGAWGAKGSLDGRARVVADTLETDLYALDTTKDGHPVHPLYQPSDADPEPWDVTELQEGSDR